jgi:hypothetical protein
MLAGEIADELEMGSQCQILDNSTQGKLKRGECVLRMKLMTGDLGWK